VDGGLAALEVLRHAAGLAGWPAPPWILALWAVFAMTLHRSLDMLRGRRLIAAALGGIGGPAAYLAAARGWGAVELVPSLPVSLAWLGVAWAAALALLATLARRDGTGTAQVLVRDVRP
jgi:hypothetical protein